MLRLSVVYSTAGGVLIEVLERSMDLEYEGKDGSVSVQDTVKVRIEKFADAMMQFNL